MSDTKSEVDPREYQELNNRLSAMKKALSSISGNAYDASTEINKVISQLSEIRSRVIKASKNSNVGANECVAAIDRIIADLANTAVKLKS